MVRQDGGSGDPFYGAQPLQPTQEAAPTGERLRKIAVKVINHYNQMLFGGGQNALKPDHDQIIDQVCADILRSAAHVFQLEANHALADGGFDLTLRFS